MSEVKVYYFNRCREIDIEVETEEGFETRNCFLASRIKIDDDSKAIVLKSDYDALKAERDALAAKLEKAKEALRFYFENVRPHANFDALIKDGGKLARQTLKEIE